MKSGSPWISFSFFSSISASQSYLGPHLLLLDKVVPVPGFIENLDLNLADTIQVRRRVEGLNGIRQVEVKVLDEPWDWNYFVQQQKVRA